MCEDKREKNIDTYWRKNTTVILAACPVGRCPFRWSSGWPSSTWIYIRLFVHRYHMNRQENSTKRWHCEGTLDVSGKPVHVRIIVLSFCSFSIISLSLRLPNPSPAWGTPSQCHTRWHVCPWRRQTTSPRQRQRRWRHWLKRCSNWALSTESNGLASPRAKGGRLGEVKGMGEGWRKK